MSQPLRTAVDPQELGAACTLRAAEMLAEAGHLVEGRGLYRHVVARYSNLDSPYYVNRAKSLLASLDDSASVVVSFRSGFTPSR